IESPKSAVASRVASRKSAASGPTESTTTRCSSRPGSRKSGLRVNSPVTVSWALTTARLYPALSLASASKLPETTMSQPSRRRAPCGEADGVDIFGTPGDAHVAIDRAALLGQTRHVEDGAALSLEMRGHAEKRANGDDPGTADTGHKDPPRFIEIR